MTDTHTLARVQEHAKLLRYRDRQALAFLQRDEALMIVVQLWCASQDHQLRVAFGVDGADDAVIANAFMDLTDETLAAALDQLGVGETLAGLEAA